MELEKREAVCLCLRRDIVGSRCKRDVSLPPVRRNMLDHKTNLKIVFF